jgi:tetratricopeptide (TPR) repeat protein
MLAVQGLHRAAERAIDGFLADKALISDAVFVARMRDHKLKALWARADRFRTRKRFAACGAAFEAMARRFPQTQQLDTFYWNAGQCYEAAGMLGPAVAMRRRILTELPRSPHAPLAAYYTAGNYHNLAFFRDAARWYERFSEQHGNHRQAADALLWAIVLRGGLGESRAMMKNAATFIQKYRRRNRRLSAKAFWLVVKMNEGLGDTDRLLINLQRYAREYAHQGDPDKAIEAHARLAALYWRRSCKVAPVHGQCIRIRYYRRKGHKKKQKRIAFLARDRRLVKAARRHVARAWALWGKGRLVQRIPRGAPGHAEAVRNARHWAAFARFMQAELRFEPYLRLRLPRGLRWDPRHARRFERTVKRFRRWIMTKLATARALERSYLATITGVRVTEQGKQRGDPHWSIAAVARTGMVYHNFAELLLSIQPPGYLRTPAERDAFIHVIERIALRFQDRAQAGYRACLQVSGKLRWFNEWSRVCERELNRLEPGRYPLAGELRARPGYVAVRPAAVGFLLKEGGVP